MVVVFFLFLVFGFWVFSFWLLVDFFQKKKKKAFQLLVLEKTENSELKNGWSARSLGTGTLFFFVNLWKI